MWTVTNPTGRLITARWDIMHSIDDALAYHKAVSAMVTKLDRPVVVSDWSRGNVMAPDVATEMLSMLSSSNTHVERVAILLAPEHATFNLQTERLVRDAKNANRRTFRQRDALIAWAGEVLTTAERQAMEQHLR